MAEAQGLLDHARTQLSAEHPWYLGRLMCRRSLVAHAAGDTAGAVHALQEAQALASELNAGPTTEMVPMIEELKRRLGPAAAADSS